MGRHMGLGTKGLLEKLDRALAMGYLAPASHCGECHKPLTGAEVSLDFCRQICQWNWYYKRTHGYVEGDEDLEALHDFAPPALVLSTLVDRERLRRTAHVPARSVRYESASPRSTGYEPVGEATRSRVVDAIRRNINNLRQWWALDPDL